MAFTKIAAAGIGSTETVTLHSLEVLNNATVGGVLTYEDVTNVDSVGLITARNGIVVGSGITLSKDGDGFFTGIVTATSFSGSGANLTGIDTDLVSDTSPQLGGDLQSNGNNIDFADNDKAIFGTGSDLEIFHNGSNSFLDNNTGNLYFRGSGGQLFFRPNNSEDALILKPNGAVELYYDNSKKLETSSSGVTLVDGLLLDNATNAGRDVQWQPANDRLAFLDNTKATFGNEIDLSIYHDGSNSYIANTTGTLLLQNSGQTTVKGSTVQFENAAGTEVLLKAVQNGAVELYYDNSKKFETTTAGVTLTGGLTASGAATINNIIYAKSDADSRIVCQVPSGNSDDWNYINFVGEDGTRDGFIGTWADGIMTIQQDGGARIKLYATYAGLSGGHHWIPEADNSNDLGSSSLRWRNLYTTDLQLSNKGKTNDVDGTWGDWTLQEGENDIFMINNRTGKKFAITMREVS